MVLTPQLRQRIEMLQMTSLELSSLIQQEMISNPVLEEVTNDEEIQEISEKILDQNADGFAESFDNDSKNDFEVNADLPANGNGASDSGEVSDYASETSEETGYENDSENAPADTADAFEEVDYGREFQEYLDPGYKTQEFEYKDDAPSFDQFLSKSESLMEHLEWQVNLLNASDRFIDAAVCIIGNLDKDGRLNASNEEIAAMCASAVEAVEAARRQIMKLEPVGCGARDVVECLLAQLESGGEGESVAFDLVRNHFTDLHPSRLNHLAKQTNLEIGEIKEELKKITCLNPYPGRLYSSEDPIYVAPEIHIEKIEGKYVIYFTDDGSPRLRISQSYQQLVGKNGTSKEAKDFIKEN